jgi:hypothetical protein
MTAPLGVLPVGSVVVTIVFPMFVGADYVNVRPPGCRNPWASNHFSWETSMSGSFGGELLKEKLFFMSSSTSVQIYKNYRGQQVFVSRSK